MKRMAAVLFFACCSLPLLAQNANRPIDDKIDSPLEYYFGAMAVLAIVMTWLWLWLKTRRSLQPPEPAEPENQP
ncbi:MAG: hypothetical protein H6840_05805 [Planctomycetes bacterium]|nr:hypothetical protein [Planctomycetota bacterium]